VRHRASPKFWAEYSALPRHIQQLADKNYELLKSDRRHPSLHLKRIGELWSVRVGDHYRALAVDDEPGGLYWIWIGTHAEYDKIVGRGRT
jgi:mRNA-degrading endonuclease RelE of RelBE toxin-antitoxin system